MFTLEETRRWDHGTVTNFPFILKESDAATLDTLADLIKQNLDYGEIEHQAGRYINMRMIVNEIIDNNIPGDIVEFGTYQGLGLLMLAQLFAKDITSRKFIGIDSFEGLPVNSTIWRQGQLTASYDVARTNIDNLFPNNSNLSYELIQGWFKEQHVAHSIYQHCPSVSLVHFDADLGISTTEALAVIDHYLTDRVDPMYLLFDDWSCHPDEVPAAFERWAAVAQDKFNLQVKELSSTKITKYFKVTFNR